MRWIPTIGALLVALLPGAATASSLPEGHCFNASQPNADYEAYGPTDVNAQTGDGRLTVNENAAGTLTVFKYPNPSYYNQVKYLAISRDARGRVQAQFPNEGSFAGIAYRTAHGWGFAWLRTWSSSQTYDSPDTPVPVTFYRSPARLGLTVADADLVAPGTSTLVRQFWVARSKRSPVRTARLVYFENFNPIASRIQYAPVEDWCLSQLSDQSARFNGGVGAILNSWHGVDQATGRPSSVAIAIGFDHPATEHQVGGDGYDQATLPGQPPDPYLHPLSLNGVSSATGQTTGALALGLHFDRLGRANARVEIAGGRDPVGAIASLETARRQSFRYQLEAVDRYWRRWLARTLLPATGDSRVTYVAKRTLITVRLAIDPDSGAIVASSDTQGPYGEDWVRDGSFINQVLDRNGYEALVTRHNLFYAAIQTSLQNPSPLRPPGNWAMTSYGDGIDGGPIAFEIDETGLGIWALADHAHHLAASERTPYLLKVFPAISRAADFLTACVDPLTGLQCPANEDDNFTPSESLHGAETTELGLRSALAAAAALGRRAGEIDGWRSRLARLDRAIAALYDPATHSYREGNAKGNAYNVEYGDGGWLLWPVRFRPYSDPTMRGEAAAVARSMSNSLRAPHGEYEAKALLALAHAWSRPTPTQAALLRSTLSYIAARLTTPTGLLGEAWERFGGVPRPVEDMPHVWEHSLFYLAALQIDGARPYRFARSDLLGNGNLDPL